MSKKAASQLLPVNYDLDLYNEDDPSENEHLIEFHKLIFDELLCNINNVPFDDIINTRLTYDGATVNDTIKSNSLHWLYTADRLRINDKIIYTFRFGNPCHPDYYKSFVTKHHAWFMLSKKNRHRSEEWYCYTGRKLPQSITEYLNIDRIHNEQHYKKPNIFVNNESERLDIEFYLQSGHDYQRLTITFEPGYPAVVKHAVPVKKIYC